MRLFLDQSGPLLRYSDGVLHIEDLNPEVKLRWQVSGPELFKIGLRCLLASAARLPGLKCRHCRRR